METKNPPIKVGFSSGYKNFRSVSRVRLELTTNGLKGHCSTNCATGSPIFIKFFLMRHSF